MAVATGLATANYGTSAGGSATSGGLVYAGPLASPEGSTIVVTNGVPTVPPNAPNYVAGATGNPMITDVNGIEFSFIVNTSGQAVTAPLPTTNQFGYQTGYEVSASGQVWSPGVQMTIRQGEMWLLSSWVGGGQPIGSTGSPEWFEYPSGTTAAAPPAPLSSTPAAGVATGAMPLDPTAVSPAPGTSGNIILCGPSQASVSGGHVTLASAVAAANNGDTIQLDAGAVFNESVAVNKAVLINGQGTVAEPGTNNAGYWVASAAWTAGATTIMLVTPNIAAPDSPPPVAGMTIYHGASDKTLGTVVSYANGTLTLAAPGAVVASSTASDGLLIADFSGGAVIDGTGIADPSGYANQLGGLVPTTDCIIRGCEVRMFGVEQETTPGGTAGIRSGGSGRITVDNCFVHDCQMGLFAGTFPTRWVVSDTILIANGLGYGNKTSTGGVAHNVYFTTMGTGADPTAPAVSRAVFANVTSIMLLGSTAAPNHATGTTGNGHALKSRAAQTTIIGGYYYSPDASPIDFPGGSTENDFAYGTTIVKLAGDPNFNVLSYGEEDTNSGSAGAVFEDCSFEVACQTPFMQIAANCTIDISGSATTANIVAQSGGGKIVGP